MLGCFMQYSPIRINSMEKYAAREIYMSSKSTPPQKKGSYNTAHECKEHRPHSISFFGTLACCLIV